MGLLDSLRTLFGKATVKPTQPPPPSEPESEIIVPEISPVELQSEIQSTSCPVLLDVREQYEWNQVRIPSANGRTTLHIPMNDLPGRLAELPKAQKIIVFCAHGSRSYGVTAWLNEQGYNARNLAGGITQWARIGGEVQTGKASGGGTGGWQ